MRAAATLLFGLLFGTPGSLLADGTEIEDPERLNEISEWSELCEITDCDRFPVGYHTHVFGSEVYYFPTGRTMAEKEDFFVDPLLPGGFVEFGEDGELVRSVGLSGGLIISSCCNPLLAFYDLIDQIPEFRPGVSKPRINMMMPGRMSIRSRDRPARENQLGWTSDYDGEAAPTMESFLSEDQPSYKDDFWLMEIGDIDSRGFRGFGFLSKRPLLLGRHVQGGCSRICSFATVSFAETASETRPHIFLRYLYITDENVFLCSPEEFEAGCDPASETMDKVKTMLLVLDDMFDTA
ncbi:hypothetical protein [Jannaschia aquimarina]|uniref:Uncharacterized protein n=1 Tax=Jannaschia aquimarina TaxID=935700 RepID=A0A0D1DD90_9RHOB|nr:hypothetical protein [Jannaschia aquimarina]KIT17963.1 hypothetical protein jaqu_03200 [Jannaschia aquimarina]SNT07915.1 hypothetical protein SAMN05421775_105153 [Jannaschia aquimarina]